MTKFDPKNLRMLSPDADDWNDLVNEHSWLVQENAICGVLLYPKKGTGRERLDTEMTDWIGSMYSYAHGGLKLIIKPRGDDWAVIYHITAWYNHFDLNEEYE